MKKTNTLILSFLYFGKYIAISQSLLNASNSKKLFVSLLTIVCAFYANATNYFTVSGATNTNSLASWTTSTNGVGGINPLSFTNAGDVFNVRAGETMLLTADLNIAANTFNVVGNGTFNCQGFILSGTAGSIFNLSNTGTLKIGSADGITLAGNALGNIQTAVRTYSNGANAGNFEYNAATGNQSTGNGLPAGNILSIIINTATSAQVVSLTNAGTTKIGSSSSQSVGSLILTNGIFNIGAGNTIEFIATQSGGNITNNGGNIASSGLNGEDGGTILSDASSGGGFLIGGTAATTFYNFTFVQNATLNFATAATPSFIINGTFSIPNNNWGWGSNAKSPIYGPASTLSVNRTGQVPLTSQGIEWIGTPTATPTIGVTPGYPNNVILTTSSTGTSTFTGNRGLNGTLTLNSNSRLDLTGITGDFVVGGSIIFNGTGSNAQPNLTAPPASNIILKGNWSRALAAVFAPNSATAVTFAGNGSVSTPQTISVSTGTETQFSNIIIDNGTYVKTNNSITLPTGGTLTLTAGILETSTANIISITNSSPFAIAGGSANGYVNGPLKWTLAYTTSDSYQFPVGKGTSYLPFTILPNTSSANIATVEAFNTSCGGSPDGTTVTSLSTTEYWSLSTSANFSTGASVSVSRPTAISPLNGLGKSTTATGVYSSVGGTPGINGISNSASIGKTSPWFFALAVAPLAVQIVNIINPTCTGTTGTVTVAGTGGNAPYQYKIDNGSFSTNATFSNLAPGNHIVTVTDGTTPIPDTARVAVIVSEPVTVNNDTTICAGGSVNLQAGGVGTNYSWSPATGLSSTNIANPVATPATTTTYTVTSEIITNLIVNPDFEAGNTGFSSDYIYLSGSQIPYVFAGAVVGNPHNGVYGIVATNNGLCSQFNPTIPDHTTGTGLMLVSDGPDDGTGASTRIWSQNISALTPNTNYTFSYWLRSAASGNPARIQAQINGVVISGGTNPVASTNAWVQVSYTWNSGPVANATIDLYDLDNNDIGNDFMIDDLAFLSSCFVSKSVTINVTNASISPTVTTVQPTCTVGTGTITVTAPATGVTYSFNNGVTYQPGATSGPLVPGTYQVVVKSGTCVSAAASVTINTPASAPSAPLATPTQPTCLISTGSITVTAPATGVTYSFDNGVTFQAGATSPALTAGITYQVVVNAGGCVSPATAVSISAAPVVPAVPTAVATQPTCAVPTGLITVTAPVVGVTYSFDNGVTFQAGMSSPVLAAGATYQVVVKNADGCVSPAAPVVINTAPGAPAAPTVSSTQPTCSVSTGLITVTAPITGVTYSFDNGVNFGPAAGSGPLAAGTYQVKINAAGCISAATAVIINTAPVIPATPTVAITQPTCTVATGTVTVTAPLSGFTYSFDNGITFQSNATSAALNAGGYQVVVKSTSGCVSPAASATINTQPAQPAVDAGLPQSIAPGGSVSLNATASAGTYLWSPSSGLSNPAILNPVATPGQTTNYVLTVTSADGCTNSDNVQITIVGDCLNPPNVFTPNGDGFYDVWVISTGACLKQTQVDVYNRWGGLVFHADNYDNKWNGAYSGKPLPDATYYYIIKATYADGHTRQVTGNVTIMR